MFTLMLYAISFLLAGVYWMGHRMIFSLVKNVNYSLTWMNIVYLMLSSLIPFGAALLGSYKYNEFALVGYGLLLFSLAFWRLIMYVYVTSTPAVRFGPVPPKRRKMVIQVLIFAPCMFLASTLICRILPTTALIIDAITPPMFVTAITLINKMEME
jgi:uncharacterized membrane protein